MFETGDIVRYLSHRDSLGIILSVTNVSAYVYGISKVMWLCGYKENSRIVKLMCTRENANYCLIKLS